MFTLEHLKCTNSYLKNIRRDLIARSKNMYIAFHCLKIFNFYMLCVRYIYYICRRWKNTGASPWILGNTVMS